MVDWFTLIALMATYSITLMVATVLAQPSRRRLVVLVDDMLDENGWTREERSFLTFLAEYPLSSTVGLMLPVSAAYAFAEAVLRGSERPDPRLRNLERDPRYKDLSRLFLISIAGGSPFAAALAIPFVAFALLVLAIRGERHLSEAVEAPIRRVSETFQAC